MNIKVIYNEGPIYIEGYAENEEERKTLVKGIQYTIKDISETASKLHKISIKSVALTQDAPEQDEPASSKQLGWLRAHGVAYDTNITKKQASKLIDATMARAAGQ